MKKDAAAVERNIVAELGDRRAKGLKANACDRLCGLVGCKNRDWDDAYDHIRLHFAPDPDKERHVLFHRKFRDKERLRELLFQAASKPSDVRVTKLKVRGDHIGRPAVEILRQFSFLVGAEPGYVWLRIFVDYRGSLITAYPAKAADGE